MPFYRRSSRPVKRIAGLRSDQTILLTRIRTAPRYPDPVRRIHYFRCRERFPTDLPDAQFLLPALTITQLYVQLESGIVFSLDQPHRRLKAFYGTSETRETQAGWPYRLRARGDCQKATGARAKP